MISSAIWNKYAQVNFSKTTKNCTSRRGRVQFVLFEKFTSSYLFQIARGNNLCHASVVNVTNEASGYFNFIGRKFDT